MHFFRKKYAFQRIRLITLSVLSINCSSYEIISYPNPDELLNKRYELVSKCRHVSKFLLASYIDRVRKNVTQLFKDIGFLIDIKTNLKILNFLDITFNLNNATFKPYKKPNDSLLYIKKVQTTRRK